MVSDLRHYEALQQLFELVPLDLREILDRLFLGTESGVLLARDVEVHVHILNVLTIGASLILFLHVDLPVVAHHHFWYSNTLIVLDVPIVTNVLLYVPHQRKRVLGGSLLNLSDVALFGDRALHDVNFLLLNRFGNLILE